MFFPFDILKSDLLVNNFNYIFIYQVTKVLYKESSNSGLIYISIISPVRSGDFNFSNIIIGMLFQFTLTGAIGLML